MPFPRVWKPETKKEYIETYVRELTDDVSIDTAQTQADDATLTRIENFVNNDETIEAWQAEATVAAKRVGYCSGRPYTGE